MTEQSPPEIVEPKSLPEGLPPPGALGAPNALEEATSRRTTLIVWGLIGLVFFGGLITMVMSWPDATLPGIGNWSFETPRIELPFDDPGHSRAEGNVFNAESAPEGMTVSEGGDAEPVGQSDKPAAE